MSNISWCSKGYPFLQSLILSTLFLVLSLLPCCGSATDINTQKASGEAVALPEDITVNNVEVNYSGFLDSNGFHSYAPYFTFRGTIYYLSVKVYLNLPATLKHIYEVGLKTDTETTWYPINKIPSGAKLTATGAIFTADFDLPVSEFQSPLDKFGSQRKSMMDQVSELQQQADLLLYNKRSNPSYYTLHAKEIDDQISQLQQQIVKLQYQINQDDYSLLASYLKNKIVLRQAQSNVQTPSYWPSSTVIDNSISQPPVISANGKITPTTPNQPSIKTTSQTTAIVKTPTPAAVVPPIQQYALRVSSDPNNGGSVTPSSGPYAAGSPVTLQATPFFPYYFKNWTGADNNSTNPTNIVINGDRSVTASFAPAVGESPTKKSGGLRKIDFVPGPNTIDPNPTASIALQLNQYDWIQGDIVTGTKPLPPVTVNIQDATGKILRDLSATSGKSSFTFMAPSTSTFNLVFTNMSFDWSSYSITYTIYRVPR